jgi:hypothetical protein
MALLWEQTLLWPMQICLMLTTTSFMAQEHQVIDGPKSFFNIITGVIAYNWALDKRLKVLRHHNVFLSGFYQESWNRATDPSSLVEQPNFYVHVPAHTDQSAAPAGESLGLSAWLRFCHNYSNHTSLITVRLHLKIHIQNSHNLETALCPLTKLYQTW